MDVEELEDDSLEPTMGEEQFVSETFAELEPILQLVGNWVASEEVEQELSQGNDVLALQEKLQKQEKLIHLLARASSDLLQSYYNAKGQTKGHDPEVDQLREEVMQLVFRNSSLQEQMKELEQQLLESDHKVEDLISHNNQLALASAAAGSSIREKMKDLRKENGDLNLQISDLVSLLKSREKQLTTEKERVKKKLSLAQELLDSKEAEIVKLEKWKKTLKQDIRQLNWRLVAAEIEADELREELEKGRSETSHFKCLLEKSELDKAECLEMLLDAKQQLNDCKEQLSRTRFIRHIQNPNSPYIDPDSLACELDRVIRDGNRCDISTSEYSSITWPDDSGSIPCDDLSLSTIDCDLVDGNVNMDAQLDFPSPMGQPGRPGTFDLEMALDRLDFVRRWKWKIYGQSRPALTFHQNASPRIARSLYPDYDMSSLTTSAFEGNVSPRSLVSFSPFQLSIRHSVAGLNDVSRMPHSGILLRGCEPPDFFEELGHSISDLEEDDDISDPLSLKSKTSKIRSPIVARSSLLNYSITASECDSGCSVAGSEVTNDEELSDAVPKSESKSICTLNFGSFKTRPPHLGTIFHRAELDRVTLDVGVAGGKPGKKESGKELPPDCIVS